MKPQQFTYTVAVLHYNAPEMLARMLSSIPERDDLEVVVVDDCSSPDNVERIKALRHRNMSLVLTPENHGAGYERNVGLDHARGRWLIAADCDDIFATGAFDVLDRYASRDDLDYICYCVSCLDGDTLKPTGHRLRSDNSVRAFLKEKNPEAIRLFKFWNTEVWNKMMSVDFLRRNNLRWEECCINIDVLFTFRLALAAKRYMAIPDELYHFVGDGNSITRKRRSIEREFGFYLQAQKRNGFFKRLGYGHPFYRPDWLYLPYMLKKRGVRETIEFYRLRRDRWSEVEEARELYVKYLDGVDLAHVLDIPDCAR